MYYVCFIPGSFNHLVWIRNILSEKLGISGHLNPRANQRAFQLRYAKKESREIIKYIYYDQNVPKLERKYNKVYNALAIDDQNNSARVL